MVYMNENICILFNVRKENLEVIQITKKNSADLVGLVSHGFRTKIRPWKMKKAPSIEQKCADPGSGNNWKSLALMTHNRR